MLCDSYKIVGCLYDLPGRGRSYGVGGHLNKFSHINTVAANAQRLNTAMALPTVGPSRRLQVRKLPKSMEEECRTGRLCTSYFKVLRKESRSTVTHKETKERWPLLTVETKVNGDSKRTN